MSYTVIPQHTLPEAVKTLCDLACFHGDSPSRDDTMMRESVAGVCELWENFESPQGIIRRVIETLCEFTPCFDNCIRECPESLCRHNEPTPLPDIRHVCKESKVYASVYIGDYLYCWVSPNGTLDYNSGLSTALVDKP